MLKALKLESKSRNDCFCAESLVGKYNLYFEESDSNYIYKNNIIGRFKGVYFSYWDYDEPNEWSENYWGRARIFPKIIWGSIIINENRPPRYPKLKFDWNPASVPYNIPTTQGCVIE